MKKIKVEDFLSMAEEQRVVEAIQKAEQTTSGEIRVHLESTTSRSALQRAAKVFHKLKMDATKDRNGILIYVAINSRCFAIYGDEGIDRVVPDHFWEEVQECITTHFKAGSIVEGLIAGIEKAGVQLQQYFPWQNDDVNELPNEISKG